MDPEAALVRDREATAMTVSGRVERAAERRVGRRRGPAVSETSAEGVVEAVGRRELHESEEAVGADWAAAGTAEHARITRAPIRRAGRWSSLFIRERNVAVLESYSLEPPRGNPGGKTP
ncbi:MAG TPA: hypothetical protein VF576_06195 [Rubricoccaceae bacterium]|jgi:hypothetical protein